MDGEEGREGSLTSSSVTGYTPTDFGEVVLLSDKSSPGNMGETHLSLLQGTHQSLLRMSPFCLFHIQKLTSGAGYGNKHTNNFIISI